MESISSGNETAIYAPKMSDIEQIKSVINASISNLKQELLQQQEVAETRITSKITSTTEFRKKGNKKQFEFNIKVEDSLNKAVDHIE